MSRRDIALTAGLALLAAIAGFLLLVRGAQQARSDAERDIEAGRQAVVQASQESSTNQARGALRAARPLSPAQIKAQIRQAEAASGVEVVEVNQSSRVGIEVRGTGAEVLLFVERLQRVRLKGNRVVSSGPALLVISVESDRLPRAQVTAIPVFRLR